MNANKLKKTANILRGIRQSMDMTDFATAYHLIEDNLDRIREYFQFSAVDGYDYIEDWLEATENNRTRGHRSFPVRKFTDLLAND